MLDLLLTLTLIIAKAINRYLVNVYKRLIYNIYTINVRKEIKLTIKYLVFTNIIRYNIILGKK